MNLYKITYSGDIMNIGFFSPQFYGGENEVDVLNKFLKECKENYPNFKPKNITAEYITDLSKIKK